MTGLTYPTAVAAAFATGSYPYSLMVTNHFDASAVSAIQTGQVLVNNERASPFGAGWTLAGLEGLHEQVGGEMVLTRGDGSTLKFTPQPTARVFSDDFEAGAAPEWSTSSTTVTPVGGRRFLGRFLGSGATNLSLTGLEPHSDLVVSLELFIIESMDGNNTSFGPDEWILRVDGSQVFRTTFAFFDTVFNFRQAFPDQFPGGDHPGGTGASEINTLEYFFSSIGPADSVYTLSFTIPHSDPGAVINFAGLLRSNLDESWGIDNVTVDSVR